MSDVQGDMLLNVCDNWTWGSQSGGDGRSVPGISPDLVRLMPLGHLSEMVIWVDVCSRLTLAAATFLHSWSFWAL